MAGSEREGEQEQRQTWSDERERRQQALHDLATQRAAEDAAAASATAASAVSTATVPHPTSLRPPRHRWRPKRVALASVALALIVIVAGVGVLHIRQQSTPTPVRTLAARLGFSPDANGIVSCDFPSGFASTSNIAWAQNGRSIAVAGYAGQCPQNDPISYAYRPGVVAIYSPATGKLMGRFDPDPAIAAALHLTPPRLPALTGPGAITPQTGALPRGDTQHQIISYHSLLWSPDGTRLALIFSVDYFFDVQPNSQSNGGGLTWNSTSWFGVATMTASGSEPVVIATPPPTFTANSVISQPWEYDLTQGRYMPPPVGPDNAFGEPQFTPGLAYAWNPDGTLAARQPLAPNSVPPQPRLGPIGNPTHDASFTIWQSGTIQPDQEYGAGVYQYSWQFAAWSPDGRYLMPAVGNPGFGELLVPGKSVFTPQVFAQSLNPAQVYLPLRDAALHAILAHGIKGTITVAWSPDGRRLAVIPEIVRQGNDQGADLGALRLYDCSSGAAIERFSGVATTGVQIARAVIAWSPDASQLMVAAQVSPSAVIAPAKTVITLWRVA